MTKRITSNKRDREKAKHEKRLEKQKRKEERQNQGASSFDDMIAYADEYGVLHSSPVDQPAEEIDVTQIAVSTPKQEEVEVLPQTGCVEYFSPNKGFGFIRDSQSPNKYFFHISNAPDIIQEGDKVSFFTEQDQRGTSAVNISIIKD